MATEYMQLQILNGYSQFTGKMTLVFKRILTPKVVENLPST